MSFKGRRRCPVCWQTVLPTTGGNVYRHCDSIGRDICPMSGEPYGFTQAGRPRVVILEAVPA